jgi:hypothetical protein
MGRPSHLFSSIIPGYFLLSFLKKRGMLTSVNSEEYEEDALSI